MKKIINKARNNKKLLISIIIFILSLISLIIYILYQNINIHQPKIISNNTNKNIDSKILEIRNLYEKNNDLIGWLKIDNTNIDYPVMYTYGLDYYLYKDFYKNYFKAGSLFIDKNNVINPRDINIIIHGHNMKNKTMFHDLINYKDENFYNEHKKIIFYTLDEHLKVRYMTVKTKYLNIMIFIILMIRINTMNIFKI